MTSSANEIKKFRDPKTWFSYVGLTDSPFDDLVAEKPKPEILVSYLSPFDFINNVQSPERCSFLFLPRGAGKSTARIRLAYKCRNRKKAPFYLAVEHTNFYGLMNTPEVTLSDHVDLILRAAIPQVFDEILSKQSLNKKTDSLDKEAKSDLVWFIVQYSDQLTDYGLTKQIRKIKDLSDGERKEVCKALLSLLKGNLNIWPLLDAAAPQVKPLVELIEKLVSIKKDSRNNLPKLKHSPIELMARFIEITEALGFKSAYILVDRVDEYGDVFGDFERVAKMLKPLIQAIPLLELPRCAFKFFLPLELRQFLNKSIRTDRFEVITFKWAESHLQKILKKRIEVFTDTKKVAEKEAQSFIRFFDPTDENFKARNLDLETEIIKFADGSPRKLLRILKTIFDEHTKAKDIDRYISWKTYRRALTKFVKYEIDWRSGENKAIHELNCFQFKGRRRLEDLLERDYDEKKPDKKLQEWIDRYQFHTSHFNLKDIVYNVDCSKTEAWQKAMEWEEKGVISAHFKIEDPALSHYLFYNEEEADEPTANNK